MSESVDAAPAWLVACLCAAWCRTCDDYRPTFDALAREFEREARFVWVDIEYDEEALGDVDVVDFPRRPRASCCSARCRGRCRA